MIIIMIMQIIIDPIDPAILNPIYAPILNIIRANINPIIAVFEKNAPMAEIKSGIAVHPDPVQPLFAMHFPLKHMPEAQSEF